MNGLIVIIGCVLLGVIMKKILFPPTNWFMGFIGANSTTNLLAQGQSKAQAKTFENKPTASDPANNTNINNTTNNINNTNTSGNISPVRDYRDFNPAYGMIDNSDGTLNINLGENQIERVTLNGEGLTKVISGENSEDEQNLSQIDVKNEENIENRLSNGKDVKNLFVSTGNATMNQDIERGSFMTQNMQSLSQQGTTAQYIEQLKEIKGPVKTMLVDKFTAPEGFKIENFVGNTSTLRLGEQNNKINQAEGNMQQLSSELGEQKNRKIKTFKRIDPEVGILSMAEFNRFNENIADSIHMLNEEAMPQDGQESIENKTSETKTLVEGTSNQEQKGNENSQIERESKKVIVFKGNNQIPIKEISNEINNPENKNLSEAQIITISKIKKQLREEDERKMLSQPGHTPYLTRSEVSELNRKEELYANIYRVAKQQGMPGMNDKKSIRNIANKITSMQKLREEKASNEASKQVEKNMPGINRNAFRQTLTEDSSATGKFVSFMSQYIDLDDVEPSEEEKKEYREQAIKNMEARSDMSPEAIEEEYDRLYNKGKEQKMLDKIFSSNSEEVREIISDIINVPEIGISIFGEEEYYNVLKEVDGISDNKYKELYNEIRANIMAELTGTSISTQSMDGANEDNKKERRKQDRISHRAAYENYVAKKKLMEDRNNADIMNALGIGSENSQEESSGVIVPIKTYTPHTLGDGSREENKAV